MQLERNVEYRTYHFPNGSILSFFTFDTHWSLITLVLKEHASISTAVFIHIKKTYLFATTALISHVTTYTFLTSITTNTLRGQLHNMDIHTHVLPSLHDYSSVTYHVSLHSFTSFFTNKTFGSIHALQKQSSM